MDVKYCFSNAVLVTWDKIPARVVEYRIEWHTREDPEKVTTSNQRERNTVARVQGLPHETEIRMRIIADILTDVREYGGDVFASLTGEWCEAETDREITDLEEENLCCDPLANIRGRCMDCDCDGFVMSTYGGNRPESRMESIACRRCACSCTRHVIIGEFSYRGPSKKAPPPKKSEPKLISLEAAAEVRKQTVEPVPEIIWKPEDAHQGDKVQFVLDKVAQARTLYETLGVPSASDDKDVRSAYRQASLIIHPDKVRGRGEADLAEQAEAAFKIITSAYEILGDEMKRMMYDRSLNKHRPTSTIGGSRSTLNGLSFIRRFLSKAGFGYDLNAKPKGDWEQTGPGQWRRSTKANIVVTHAISGDTYEAALEKGSKVLTLKRRIVKELKRGPESRIELAGVDGSDRPNSYSLGSSETLILVGIDLGPPKDVKICLCHADTGARVRVTVPDTSTMEEVRQAAALKLNCDVSKIQLGFRANNNMERFQAFEDSECLNGREQILLAGVDVVPMFTVEEALELQDELIIAYGASWFQEQLDSLLDEYPPLEGILDPEFKKKWGDLVKEAQRDTMVKHGFDGQRGVYSMLHAFTEVGSHPDVRQKVQEIDKKLRVTMGAGLPPVIPISIEQAVELDLSIVVDRMLADWPIRMKVRQGFRVRALKERLATDESTEGISANDFGLCLFSREHEGPVKQLNDMMELTTSHCSLCICDKAEPMLEPSVAQQSEGVARSVSVVVFSWSKVGDIREALAKKIGADAEKIRLVSESDSAENYVAYRDSEEVGARRKFKVLGVEIPEKVEEPQKLKQVVKEEPLIQEVVQEGQEESKQTQQRETAKLGSSTSTLPTPSSAASSKSPVAQEKQEATDEVAQERRKAEDGNHYTRKEFIEFYGAQEGGRHWIMAERRVQPKTQEKSKEPKETPSATGAKPQNTEVKVQPSSSQIDPKPSDLKVKEEKPTEEKETPSPSAAVPPPSSPLTNPESSGSKGDGMKPSANTEDKASAPEVEEKKEASAPKPIEPPKAAASEKSTPPDKPAAPEKPEVPAMLEPPQKVLHPDKPVRVEVTAKHVSSGTSVTLKIMSSSTMLMVKREIARRIGRPEVLEFGKIVQEVDGSYESFPEGDLLGLREELFFMNATLEENPSRHDVEDSEYRDAELRKNGQAPAKPKDKAPAKQDIIVKVTAIQSGVTVAVKVDKVSATAGQLKEVLAQDTGRPDLLEGKVLRRNADNSGYSSFKDEELIGARTQLHFMGPDITPAKGSAADKRIRAEMRARTNPKARAKAPAALPEPEEPEIVPELVLITISHATNTKQTPVEVAIMNTLTISSVKEALAKKLKRQEVMTKGRFVQKKGMSSFGAVRDSELIGNRKALLFMGMDLK